MATTAADHRHAGGKPRLRGVFHNFAAVAAAAAGTLLTLDASTPRARLGCAIYTLAITGMFSISASYHRPNWGPRVRQVMRRLDHSAIYFLIAGTYTPLCMIGLDSELGGRILQRVWLGAAAGILHSALMPESRSSKVISALLYVALGWTVLPYAGQLRQTLTPMATWLVVAGGVIYSVGAVIYAARWPDPYPRVFGYHEVFHTLICLAAALHFAAVRDVVRRLAGFH